MTDESGEADRQGQFAALSPPESLVSIRYWLEERRRTQTHTASSTHFRQSPEYPARVPELVAGIEGFNANEAPRCPLQ